MTPQIPHVPQGPFPQQPQSSQPTGAPAPTQPVQGGTPVPPPAPVVPDYLRPEQGYYPPTTPPQAPIASRRGGRGPFLALMALLLTAALALLAFFLLRPRPAGPTPSPSATHAATPETPGARTPLPTLAKPGSTKKATDIAWPEKIKDLSRSDQQTSEGVAVSRARYTGEFTVSGVVQKDQPVAVRGAGMRDVVDAENYRCGRLTTSAVCMADLADGTITLNATTPDTTPEKLGELMNDLLRQI